MSAQRIEEILALVYVNARERARFLQDPVQYARSAGLDASQLGAFDVIDRTGIVMAARSFAAKRNARARSRAGIAARLRSMFRR